MDEFHIVSVTPELGLFTRLEYCNEVEDSCVGVGSVTVRDYVVVSNIDDQNVVVVRHVQNAPSI